MPSTEDKLKNPRMVGCLWVGCFFLFFLSLVGIWDKSGWWWLVCTCIVLNEKMEQDPWYNIIQKPELQCLSNHTQHD